MKKKNTLFALLALFAAVLLFFGIYKLTVPKTSKGAKTVVVEVQNKEGETKKYNSKTDAEYLSELMDELSKSGDFKYEATETEYGLYIESINDEKADYSVDGSYWAIYVNGEYGQYGADQQPVNDGDTYSFVYEIADY